MVKKPQELLSKLCIVLSNTQNWKKTQLQALSIVHLAAHNNAEEDIPPAAYNSEEEDINEENDQNEQDSESEN